MEQLIKNTIPTNIQEKVLNFFYTNTLWLHWIVIWTCCIMLTAESQTQNWIVFTPILGFLSLLFAPALLFSFFRKRLKKEFSTFVYYGISVALFVIYPLLILQTSFYTNFSQLNLFHFNQSLQNHNNAMHAVLSIISLLFFLLEVLINLEVLWKREFKVLTYFKNIGLEQALFILMLMFTVFTTSVGIGQHKVIHNFQHFLYQTPYFLWAFIQGFLMLLVYYAFYWVNHYVLINKVLKKKGIIHYVLLLLFMVLVFYPIAAQFINLLPIVHEWQMHPVANGRIFEGVNFAIPFMGLLVTIPFILTIQWFKQGSEIANLEKEKSATELNLLKQQINPHFFFNTLNNLYALSLKKDETTPEVILQLSDLMRYVIYKGKEETVDLQEEIEYIEDYIELQQLRLFKKFDYRFTQKIENKNLRIPPLLFIILVENAFKHGIEPAEDNCFLYIHLENDENGLLFTCKNSYEPNVDKQNGIGLENLKQRLALRFPNQHDLNIEDNQRTFRVELRIF